MSKTFKSALEDSSYRLKVARGFSDEYLFVSVQGGGRQESIAIADKDIPSLMLALGETAGVVPKWDSWSENGTPEHLAHILSHLQQYVDAQEAIAAEAEETAELEALAQELVNAYPTIVWEELTTMGKTRWLQVAAKALELGASVDN